MSKTKNNKKPGKQVNITPVPAETTAEKELREKLFQAEKNTFEAREKLKEAEKRAEAAKAAEATAKAENKTTVKTKTDFGTVNIILAVCVLFMFGVIGYIIFQDNKPEDSSSAVLKKPENTELTLLMQQMQDSQKESEEKAEKALLEFRAESERKLAEVTEKSRLEKLESDRKLAEALATVKTVVAPAPVPTIVATPVVTNEVSRTSSTAPVTDQEMRQLQKLLNIEGQTLICGFIPDKPGPVKLPDGRMALVHPLFVDESQKMLCQIGPDQNLGDVRASIRFHNVSEPDRNTIDVVRVVQDPKTGDRYGQLGIIAEILPDQTQQKQQRQ